MKYLFLIILSVTLGVISQPLQAQQHENYSSHESSEVKHHRIALGLGHAYVPAHEIRSPLIVPTIGLDYEFWFNSRFALGLHTDLEIQSYLVEHNHQEVLERYFPLIVSIVGIYKIWEGLTIYGGPGREFEENTHLNVLRLGVEYEFEFANHWDISPGFFYDNKENVYDAWGIALLIGKKF